MGYNSDNISVVPRLMFNFESGGIKTSSDVGLLTPAITYSGIVARMDAGATIAQLNLVCFDTTTNAIIKADLDAAASYPAIGIALEAATAAGDEILVLTYGYLKCQSLDFGVRATGTVTINGNIANGEIIEINGTTYEFRNEATAALRTAALTAGSDYALDANTALTKAQAQSELTAALALYETGVTWSAWAADVMTITASKNDIAATANAITLSKTGTNIAVSGATLSGGTNGNKLWLGDAGAISKTISATSTEYNQLIGQALSMKEAFIKPDNYGLVVA